MDGKTSVKQGKVDELVGLYGLDKRKINAMLKKRNQHFIFVGNDGGKRDIMRKVTKELGINNVLFW